MRWRKPKPNIDDTSTKNSLDIELAHDRERGNSNWLINLARVYIFTPHDTRIMRLTQTITLGKGVLASTFSNKSQPFKITPNLRGESPRSTGDTPKPLYKALCNIEKTYSPLIVWRYEHRTEPYILPEPRRNSTKSRRSQSLWTTHPCLPRTRTLD
jgi:hypothetical protein